MCLDKVQSNNIIAYLHTTANVTGYLNLSSQNNTSTNTITSTNKNNYQTFLSVKNYNPLQNTWGKIKKSSKFRQEIQAKYLGKN